MAASRPVWARRRVISTAMVCSTSSRQILLTTHTLYRNVAGNDFADDTIPSGLAVNTKYLGWGAAFVDIDNDGWKDIIAANGYAYPEVAAAKAGEKFKQPRLLYWNRGDGQFFDLSSQAGQGILDEHSSRGLATRDFDNDGNEEIVIVNMGETRSLLKNTGPHLGNSLLIRAVTSGRDAIGARVTVSVNGRKQIDEVRSGGGSFRKMILGCTLGSAKAKRPMFRFAGRMARSKRFLASRRVKS